MTKDYFGEYLKIAPFALAIWRDQEARAIINAYKKHLGKNVNYKNVFKRPILDIGCGFGEFAGVFFDDQIEVGIDISLEDLIKAKSVNSYKKLIPVDARKLPFRNNTFWTVISVSVLEHVQNPDKAINEAFRVLKPKGIFIFTAVTSDLNNNLFYPKLFKFLGFQKFADLYLTYYHKAFKHVNVLNPEEWVNMTKNAGFRMLLNRGTFSSRLSQVFDITLLTALPSQITRWLFGSRMVWGLSLKRKILDPIYKFCLRDKIITKSNLLIIAQKV